MGEPVAVVPDKGVRLGLNQTVGPIPANRFVDFDNTATPKWGMELAGADVLAFGVTTRATIDNERTDVQVLGAAIIEVGAAVAIGAKLSADAAGRAITAGTGGIMGRAVTAGANAGDLIVMELTGAYDPDIGGGSAFPMTDYVIVESKSDLPAPVAGAIILLANTVYQFNGLTTLGTDHIEISAADVYMRGVFADRDTLTYTGTGAAIRVSGGVNFKWRHLGLTTATSTGFSVVDAPFSLIENMSFFGNKIGTFEDCATAALSDCNAFTLDEGIDLINASSGTNFLIRGGNFVQLAGTGTLVDLGSSVWDFFEINAAFLISAAGGTDISGLAANGNLTAVTGRGVIMGCRLNGVGAHLVGIDPDDTRWEVTNSTGTPDSRNIGSLAMNGNAVATDMSGGAGVMVKVAGVTTLVSQRRFDDDGGTDNRLKYIGVEPITALVNVVAGVTKVAASIEACSLQVFKNGIAVTPLIGFVASNQARGAVITVPVDMVTDDYVEAFMTNEDATNDLTAIDLSMVASSI